MKLSTFKQNLQTVSALNFVQPNGTFIPQHFHITEAGLTIRHFIDCGNTIRNEKAITLQVWVAQDVNHRLEPRKLLGIISTAENLFHGEDLDVEIEFQTETIGRYGLGTDGENFLLLPKETDCLAKDHCGIPVTKLNRPLSELTTSQTSCCTPGGGCC